MSERTRALTLRPRRIALTLPDRTTNPGVIITGGAGDDMVLQGFEYAGVFASRAFILYGLAGTATSTGTAYGLTLRPRRIALTL